MEYKCRLLSQGESQTGEATDQGQIPIRSFDPSPAGSTELKGCCDCFAALAHRLAQPMTALRGGIELALAGKHCEAEYRAALEQSLQLADTMAQMIVSLRNLGESCAPGGPPRAVELDIAATEVITELEALAQSRDLRLQLRTVGKAQAYANPERLRDVFQSLLAWAIDNSAGGGVLEVEITAEEGESHVVLFPPRIDVQYLQVKILQDLASPGQLFSHAAKNGALGWVITQRLVNGLGGRLEILSDGTAAKGICMYLPSVPAT